MTEKTTKFTPDEWELMSPEELEGVIATIKSQKEWYRDEDMYKDFLSRAEGALKKSRGVLNE